MKKEKLTDLETSLLLKEKKYILEHGHFWGLIDGIWDLYSFKYMFPVLFRPEFESIVPAYTAKELMCMKRLFPFSIREADNNYYLHYGAGLIAAGCNLPSAIARMIMADIHAIVSPLVDEMKKNNISMRETDPGIYEFYSIETSETCTVLDTRTP